MNRAPKKLEFFGFFWVYLLIVCFFLWQFYKIPLFLFFCLGAVLLGNLWYLKKINDTSVMTTIVKVFIILMIFFNIGSGIFVYKMTPWRKFSREPPSFYMALVETCKQLLELENLLDMTTDSRRALIDAAKRSGVKHPYADIPKKPGDDWIDVDPDNIHFPDEILRYFPFEVGIVRNQVFMKFITDKPEPFYVDIQYFPNNDNKWVITQNRVWGGIGVLWEGTVGGK